MYPVVRREPIIYRELHDRQCPIQDILNVLSVKDGTLYIWMSDLFLTKSRNFDC